MIATTATTASLLSRLPSPRAATRATPSTGVGAGDCGSVSTWCASLFDSLGRASAVSSTSFWDTCRRGIVAIREEAGGKGVEMSGGCRFECDTQNESEHLRPLHACQGRSHPRHVSHDNHRCAPATTGRSRDRRAARKPKPKEVKSFLPDTPITSRTNSVSAELEGEEARGKTSTYPPKSSAHLTPPTHNPVPYDTLHPIAVTLATPLG